MIWDLLLMTLVTSTRVRRLSDLTLLKAEIAIYKIISSIGPRVKRSLICMWENKMVLLVLMLTVQVNYLLVKTLAEEVHVPMPLVCDEPLPHNYLTHKNCWESCNLEHSGSFPRNITIYQQTVNIPMQILECRTVRSKTRFTQTWTFSKFRTEFPDDLLPPDDRKCWDFVKKNCQSRKKCESIRPEIEENYVYAADNDKYIEWAKINLHTIDAPVSINQQLHIRLEGKLVSYDKGAYQSQADPNLHYLWDPKAEIKCNAKPAFHTQCNVIENSKGEVTKYICGRGNLMITPLKVLDHSACVYQEGIWISEEGIIYDTRTSGKLVHDSLPIYSNLATDAIKTLIMQTRVSRLMQEEELCKSNCLNFKLSSDNELSYYGKKPVFRLKENQIRGCRESYSCQITLPTRVCRGNNLLSITCDNQEMWWNVSSSVVLPDEGCDEQQEVDKERGLLIMRPGGFFRVNESGIYHVAGKEIHRQFRAHSLNEGIMLLDTEKIQVSLKQSDGLVAHDKVPSNDNIMKKEWGFGIIGFLERVEHNIKVTIVGILSTFASVFILYVMFIKERSPKGYQSPPIEMINY
nr:TPA_asm: G [Sesamum betacytorhabdovirus 1_Ses]